MCSLQQAGHLMLDISRDPYDLRLCRNLFVIDLEFTSSFVVSLQDL